MLPEQKGSQSVCQRTLGHIFAFKAVRDFFSRLGFLGEDQKEVLTEKARQITNTRIQNPPPSRKP